MTQTSAKTFEVLRFDSPVPYREGYEAQITRRNLVETGAAGEALYLLERASSTHACANSVSTWVACSNERIRDSAVDEPSPSANNAKAAGSDDIPIPSRPSCW